MTRLSDTCPVCGMAVVAGISSVEYHKMYFHFCSTQCRETFIAHPSLYGAKIGKERNEILKQRTMRLTEPLESEVTDLLIPYLMEMMGVKEVVAEDDKIHITYDLLQVTESQIEKTLVEVGLQLGGGWLSACAVAGCMTGKRSSWIAWLHRPRLAVIVRDREPDRGDEMNYRKVTTILETVHVGEAGEGIIAVLPVEKFYQIHPRSEVTLDEI